MATVEFHSMHASRSTPDDGDEVSYAMLLSFFTRHWLPMAACALVGAVGAFAFALQIPRVYRGETMVTPVSESGNPSGLRALASRFGALSGAAGGEFDPGGNYSTAAVVAMLKSRQFLEDFISSHNLLPILFAERWDARLGTWKKGPEAKPPPALEDGYDVFSTRVLSIAEDRKTGLITVRADWTDRELAAAWANQLVADINTKTRELTIQDANRSLEYLTKELANAQELDIKRSMYSLVESQMNRRMLAVTRPDFSFRVIDKAQPSSQRKYLRPRRSRYAILGLFGGAIAGVALALLIQIKGSRSVATAS